MENEEFLNNAVIKSFLEIPSNKNLLINVICHSTPENQAKLDYEFKKYYFNIRFTSFVSNTLYFNAINYDKRYRKVAKRYPLTVDKPLGNEENTTLKDTIKDESSEITIDCLINSAKIEDYILDPILIEAIRTLTVKQKEVIDLAYVFGMSDTAITKMLNKSQQAISKLHKKALEKIYNYIVEKRGDGDDYK